MGTNERETAVRARSAPLFLNRRVNHLFLRAQDVVGGSQEELGRVLGVSRKTAARYQWGHSQPTLATVKELARLVYARGDSALAAELADAAEETLESLGLVATAAPRDVCTGPTRVVANAVVYAAADAFETAPGTMRGARAAVLAAFRCARELQLGVEEVERALTPPEPAPEPAPEPPPPPTAVPGQASPAQRPQSRSRSSRRPSSSGA